MVGSVVVHGDKIIGEGFTDPFGGPHAEVNAIAAVKDRSLLLQATLYVTLEPCSHHGKTPPCADMIIRHQIPKVVIGIADPHEKVAGNGIRKLREAGVEVTVGVLERECREHHKRFLSLVEKKRPYIVLKWAESTDGFMAPAKTLRSPDPAPFWITTATARQLVHKWRSEEQAILVGTNTVLEDNPKLNLRTWYGKPPIRIILDRDLRIGKDFHVMDKSVPTLVLTQIKDPSRYVPGIDYESMDFNQNRAAQICAVLCKHNIVSVLVEGGSQTLQCFLDEALWDEARIFTGPSTFGKGLRAPSPLGKLVKTVPVLTDTLKIFKNDQEPYF
jgi:diaminohydroxyphosphoribosylaminopyrimidine deaminase/5-amino-6-(5-phosphoribosylamino)uracil reductase